MRRAAILAGLVGSALLSPACGRAQAPPPPPNEVWIEARSANFTLVGNAAPKAVERIAVDLERLRAALAQIFPGLQLSSPHPTTIYVFKNAASFAPYQRYYNGRSAEVGGYFLSREYANYVAIGATPKGDDRALIYHEFLHSVLRNNYSDLPLWLNEGLAEYYSTFEVARGEAKIGLPIAPHAAWLRLHTAMPVRRLLELDQSSPEYNETERRGGFYALSWALTHYLMGEPKGRTGQIAELLRLLQRGTAPGEAVRTALATTPEALDKELVTYLKSYSVPYIRVPIAEGSDPAVTIRSLPRHELLYRLGDLLASLDEARADDAGKTLRGALELQPDYGPAYASLAQLAERSGRREEAKTLHARAAALSPEDWIVQYLYARNLIEDSEAGDLLKAREALRKVVRLRPQMGEAWADLGYTYQNGQNGNGQNGAELGREAIAALETAHLILPGRRDVTHNLGIAYATYGRVEEAQRLVEGPLRADAEAATSVREAILHQRLRDVEELIRQQKLAEALPLLAAIQKETSRPDFGASLARQIAEIEEVIAHNRFVAAYNEAVDKVNRGDLKGATAQLEKLVAETLDPASLRQARELLARVQEHASRRKR